MSTTAKQKTLVANSLPARRIYRETTDCGTTARPHSVEAGTGTEAIRIETRMPTTFGRKTLFAASATAISALGLLTGPAPAQAAPGCEVYGFAGEVTITGDGAIGFLRFSANGTSAHGTATAMSDKGAAMTGFISGGIIEDGPGIHLTFTPDVALAGGPYVFTGEIRQRDLIAVGSQVGGSWSTEDPLACLQTGAQPDPGPPPPPMATVVGEAVDVYERPNINDDLTPIGILQVNKQVQLVGDCQPEAWCQVKGPDVPTGQGFIWGHLDLP